MDKLQDLVDRLAAAVLDLNRRVADSGVVVVAALDLLESKGIVTREEFNEYRASLALQASGLKSFDIEDITA